MDLELGRCRRTDGKKWRCYKSVVPDQKYCENHMHRGSKRSRKLVEAVTLVVPNVIENANENPENTPGFDVPAIKSRKSQPLSEPSEVVVHVPGLTNTSAKREEELETNDAVKVNMVLQERIATELPLSPKSVLQEGHSCSGVEYHVKGPRQLSLRWRTDGRKWKCNNEALPGHKYSAQHISRELKKPIILHSATAEPKTAHITSSATKLSGPEKTGMGMDMDSDLKITLSMKLIVLALTLQLVTTVWISRIILPFLLECSRRSYYCVYVIWEYILSFMEKSPLVVD